jgi:hypothetical protein
MNKIQQKGITYVEIYHFIALMGQHIYLLFIHLFNHSFIHSTIYLLLHYWPFNGTPTIQIL